MKATRPGGGRMHRSGQRALDRQPDPRGAQVVANVLLPGRSDPAGDDFQCPDVKEQRCQGCLRAGLLLPAHRLHDLREVRIGDE
jgi:hypothetical protein